ncbi:MAG: peptide chain release factor N(5)-glutamine methyltransferase [Alphaproteobacteria bacterium]
MTLAPIESARTVGVALSQASRLLAAAGVVSPRLDARLLAAHVLGLEPSEVALHPERPLSPSEEAALTAAVARRAAREPVSRIIARRGFWTLTLTVSPDTLDPRPDSETVVEAALEAVPRRNAPLAILDFGTGTGCLLLALLAELPRARGLGVDIAPGAVATARQNATRCGLAERARFEVGDWGHGLDGPFDLIVANPPYIPDAEIDGLAPEVACFEPRLALAGGVDGLAAYRALAPHLRRLLRPGGVAVLEVGAGQATPAGWIMEGEGLVLVGERADLSGTARCIVVRAPGG